MSSDNKVTHLQIHSVDHCSQPFVAEWDVFHLPTDCEDFERFTYEDYWSAQHKWLNLQTSPDDLKHDLRMPLAPSVSWAPVIRVIGRTSAGLSCCLHVHGQLPTVFAQIPTPVAQWIKWLREVRSDEVYRETLAALLEHWYSELQLQLCLKLPPPRRLIIPPNPASETHRQTYERFAARRLIHAIDICRSYRSVFGYSRPPKEPSGVTGDGLQDTPSSPCVSQDALEPTGTPPLLLLRVYGYSVKVMDTLETVFRSGSFGSQRWQPFQSHISYTMRFLVAHKVGGMNFLTVKQMVSRSAGRSSRVSTAFGRMPVLRKRFSTCDVEADIHVNFLQRRQSQIQQWVPNRIYVPSLQVICNTEDHRRARVQRVLVVQRLIESLYLDMYLCGWIHIVHEPVVSTSSSKSAYATLLSLLLKERRQCVNVLLSRSWSVQLAECSTDGCLCSRALAIPPEAMQPLGSAQRALLRLSCPFHDSAARSLSTKLTLDARGTLVSSITAFSAVAQQTLGGSLDHLNALLRGLLRMYAWVCMHSYLSSRQLKPKNSTTQSQTSQLSPLVPGYVRSQRSSLSSPRSVLYSRSTASRTPSPAKSEAGIKRGRTHTSIGADFSGLPTQRRKNRVLRAQLGSGNAAGTALVGRPSTGFPTDAMQRMFWSKLWRVVQVEQEASQVHKRLGREVRQSVESCLKGGERAAFRKSAGCLSEDHEWQELMGTPPSGSQVVKFSASNASRVSNMEQVMQWADDMQPFIGECSDSSSSEDRDDQALLDNDLASHLSQGTSASMRELDEALAAMEGVQQQPPPPPPPPPPLPSMKKLAEKPRGMSTREWYRRQFKRVGHKIVDVRRLPNGRVEYYVEFLTVPRSQYESLLVRMKPALPTNAHLKPLACGTLKFWVAADKLQRENAGWRLIQLYTRSMASQGNSQGAIGGAARSQQSPPARRTKNLSDDRRMTVGAANCSASPSSLSAEEMHRSPDKPSGGTVTPSQYSDATPSVRSASTDSAAAAVEGSGTLRKTWTPAYWSSGDDVVRALVSSSNHLLTDSVFRRPQAAYEKQVGRDVNRHSLIPSLAFSETAVFMDPRVYGDATPQPQTGSCWEFGAYLRGHSLEDDGRPEASSFSHRKVDADTVERKHGSGRCSEHGRFDRVCEAHLCSGALAVRMRVARGCPHCPRRAASAMLSTLASSLDLFLRLYAILTFQCRVPVGYSLDLGATSGTNKTDGCAMWLRCLQSLGRSALLACRDGDGGWSSILRLYPDSKRWDGVGLSVREPLHMLLALLQGCEVRLQWSTGRIWRHETVVPQQLDSLHSSDISNADLYSFLRNSWRWTPPPGTALGTLSVVGYMEDQLGLSDIEDDVKEDTADADVKEDTGNGDSGLADSDPPSDTDLHEDFTEYLCVASCEVLTVPSYERMSVAAGVSKILYPSFEDPGTLPVGAASNSTRGWFAAAQKVGGPPALLRRVGEVKVESKPFWAPAFPLLTAPLQLAASAGSDGVWAVSMLCHMRTCDSDGNQLTGSDVHARSFSELLVLVRPVDPRRVGTVRAADLVASCDQCGWVDSLNGMSDDSRVLRPRKPPEDSSNAGDLPWWWQSDPQGVSGPLCSGCRRAQTLMKRLRHRCSRKRLMAPEQVRVAVASSEVSLLSMLVRYMMARDPDLLLGYDLHRGSFMLLDERSKQLGLHPQLADCINRTNAMRPVTRSKISAGIASITRNQNTSAQAAKAVAYRTQKLTPLMVKGRILVNLWRVVRDELHIRNFSYENVIRHAVQKTQKERAKLARAVAVDDAPEPVCAFWHAQVAKWGGGGCAGERSVSQAQNQWEPFHSLPVLSTSHQWSILCGCAHEWTRDDNAAADGLAYLVLPLTSRVLGNWFILEELQILNRTIELSRAFGILFTDVLLRGSQFRVESMLSRVSHEFGFLLPHLSPAQVASQRATSCIAMNMEPLDRFYGPDTPVAVLDFRSLYPSIMIGFNICYCTCLGLLPGLWVDQLPGKPPAKENPLVGPDGDVVVRKGHGYQTLTNLLGTALKHILTSKGTPDDSAQEVKSDVTDSKAPRHSGTLDAHRSVVDLHSSESLAFAFCAVRWYLGCVRRAVCGTKPTPNVRKSTTDKTADSSISVQDAPRKQDARSLAANAAPVDTDVSRSLPRPEPAFLTQLRRWRSHDVFNTTQVLPAKKHTTAVPPGPQEHLWAGGTIGQLGHFVDSYSLGWNGVLGGGVYPLLLAEEYLSVFLPDVRCLLDDADGISGQRLSSTVFSQQFLYFAAMFWAALEGRMRVEDRSSSLLPEQAPSGLSLRAGRQFYASPVLQVVINHSGKAVPTGTERHPLTANTMAWMAPMVLYGLITVALHCMQQSRSAQGSLELRPSVMSRVCARLHAVTMGRDVPRPLYLCRGMGGWGLDVPVGEIGRLALCTNARGHSGLWIAPNGCVFVREWVQKGILGTLLGEVLETRFMVKQTMASDRSCQMNSRLYELLNAKQTALKLIANVTYGYTGASASGRMPCAEIADAIVSTGRAMMVDTIEQIHRDPLGVWKGAKVVYGDTDSVFVAMPGCSVTEAFERGERIANFITRRYPSPIRLELERVYSPCVLMAKKRYFGWRYDKPPPPPCKSRSRSVRPRHFATRRCLATVSQWWSGAVDQVGSWGQGTSDAVKRGLSPAGVMQWYCKPAWGDGGFFEGKGIETVRRDGIQYLSDLFKSTMWVMFASNLDLSAVKRYLTAVLRQIHAQDHTLPIHSFLFGSKVKMGRYAVGSSLPRAVHVANQRIAADPGFYPNSGERIPFLQIFTKANGKLNDGALAPYLWVCDKYVACLVSRVYREVLVWEGMQCSDCDAICCQRLSGDRDSCQGCREIFQVYYERNRCFISQLLQLYAAWYRGYELDAKYYCERVVIPALQRVFTLTRSNANLLEWYRSMGHKPARKSYAYVHQAVQVLARRYNIQYASAKELHWNEHLLRGGHGVAGDCMVCGKAMRNEKSVEDAAQAISLTQVDSNDSQRSGNRCVRHRSWCTSAEQSTVDLTEAKHPCTCRTRERSGYVCAECSVGQDPSSGAPMYASVTSRLQDLRSQQQIILRHCRGCMRHAAGDVSVPPRVMASSRADRGDDVRNAQRVHGQCRRAARSRCASSDAGDGGLMDIEDLLRQDFHSPDLTCIPCVNTDCPVLYQRLSVAEGIDRLEWKRIQMEL